jgi:Domain of unknown function (DUF1707)
MNRPARDYPASEFRVSDADRDRALSELSDAFQRGRITADELDQRSGQVLTARTGRELTAPLADLPADHAGAPPASALERAHRVLVARVCFAAGIVAFCFGAVAVGNAVTLSPSRQQLELVRELAARQGLPVPSAVPPSPGFDWAGVTIPAAIAVVLVALIIYLRNNRVRVGRP